MTDFPAGDEPSINDFAASFRDPWACTDPIPQPVLCKVTSVLELTLDDLRGDRCPFRAEIIVVNVGDDDLTSEDRDAIARLTGRARHVQIVHRPRVALDVVWAVQCANDYARRI